MPSVLGQVGQNVADSLFEIGQSAVKGTAGAVTDIAHESIEQIVTGSKQNTAQGAESRTIAERGESDQRKIADKQRFEEVRAELSRFIQRKKQLDQKIAEEQMAQSQQAKQESFVEKKKRDNWVNRIINRSQTGTERGRLSE